MAHTIPSATARFSRQIPEGEAAIDQAIASVSALISEAAQARSDTKVAASTGQAALLRLHKTLGNLIGASSEMARAHAEMLKVGQEIGILDEPECPDSNGLLSATALGKAA